MDRLQPPSLPSACRRLGYPWPAPASRSRPVVLQPLPLKPTAAVPCKPVRDQAPAGLSNSGKVGRKKGSLHLLLLLRGSSAEAGLLLRFVREQNQAAAQLGFVVRPPPRSLSPSPSPSLGKSAHGSGSLAAAAKGRFVGPSPAGGGVRSFCDFSPCGLVPSPPPPALPTPLRMQRYLSGWIAPFRRLASAN